MGSAITPNGLCMLTPARTLYKTNCLTFSLVFLTVTMSGLKSKSNTTNCLSSVNLCHRHNYLIHFNYAEITYKMRLSHTHTDCNELLLFVVYAFF